MTFRKLPPVYSPLDLRALAMGLAAIFTGGSGPRRRLEQWLQARYGATRVMLTDSGTTALTLAIRAVVDSKGPRRVALPAYACYDLATAADGADVEVVLYDLDPNTLGPEWASFTRAVSAGVGAVVLVHLYGIPVDIGRAMEIATSHGVAVIEDAAQGVGASYDGRPLGSFGEYSVLSFGRGKGLTGGGGGALLIHGDRDIPPLNEAENNLLSAGQGIGTWTKAWIQWVFSRPELFAIPSGLPFLGLGETFYRPARPGARLSAPAVGTLEGVLQLIEPEAERRRKNAVALKARLRQLRGIREVVPPTASIPGYLRLPVNVDPSVIPRWRDGTARALGVTRGYPLPLSRLQGFLPRVANLSAEFPGAQALSTGLFTLPVHGQLAHADVARLKHWLTD